MTCQLWHFNDVLKYQNITLKQNNERKNISLFHFKAFEQTLTLFIVKSVLGRKLTNILKIMDVFLL